MACSGRWMQYLYLKIYAHVWKRKSRTYVWPCRKFPGFLSFAIRSQSSPSRYGDEAYLRLALSSERNTRRIFMLDAWLSSKCFKTNTLAYSTVLSPPGTRCDCNPPRDGAISWLYGDVQRTNRRINGRDNERGHGWFCVAWLGVG